jgi:hypothetical protein
MQARIAQRPDIPDQRRETVEHPFGSIKQWMNQGAFLMRGLEKVRGEFSLTAEDQFLPPKLSARSVIRKQTVAATRGNGRDAVSGRSWQCLCQPAGIPARRVQRLHDGGLHGALRAAGYYAAKIGDHHRRRHSICADFSSTFQAQDRAIEDFTLKASCVIRSAAAVPSGRGAREAVVQCEDKAEAGAGGGAAEHIAVIIGLDICRAGERERAFGGGDAVQLGYERNKKKKKKEDRKDRGPRLL